MNYLSPYSSPSLALLVPVCPCVSVFSSLCTGTFSLTFSFSSVSFYSSSLLCGEGRGKVKRNIMERRGRRDREEGGEEKEIGG